MFGIDVSEHQGVIDWEKVKGQVDYAILRIGYGSDFRNQDDRYFKRNADECTRLGIPFGVYIYSYAQNLFMAKSEAAHVLRMIEGYRLDYPVYYDMEDAAQAKLGNHMLGSMYEAFRDTIEAAGYWCGIYANLYWFTNLLTDESFSRGTRWLAQYADRETPSMDCSMWQYSSSGRIEGISGNVDVNRCYYNFPENINPKKKEYDMKKIIVYYGDADVFAAILLSQRFSCPVMKKSDFDQSGLHAEEVIQVGGRPEDKDRFATFRNAAARL